MKWICKGQSQDANKLVSKLNNKILLHTNYRMKILAVDDNQTNLKVVASYIKGLGHDVINATSGEDAVECFAEQRPDMVLMDIMMPVTRFVATSLIAIDLHNYAIEVWNGVNLTIYYCNENGEVHRALESSSPALGIIPEDSFNSNTDMIVAEQPGSIIICSDGLLDAENAAGQHYGEERLLAVLKEPGDHYSNIKNSVKAFIGDN